MLFRSGLSGNISGEIKPEDAFPQKTAVIVKQNERQALINALRQADGNQTEAAKYLGVSRITVWKRMKKYKVTVKTL